MSTVVPHRYAAAFAGMLALAALPAVAGSGRSINWYAIHAGGTSQSAGGDYRLSGTIGQPAPGFAEGGDYALNAGFWVAAPLVSDLIFTNAFEGN